MGSDVWGEGMTTRPFSDISSPDRVDADDTERSVFVLRLEAKPGAAGIRQLRALLKALLRRHGFRCVDAREIRGQQR